MAEPHSFQWAEVEAPSLEDIETMAQLAFKRLPSGFRQFCEDLIIRVEDLPAEEVLQELDIEDELELMGLFQGVGLAQNGAVAASGMLPNVVLLYRRPILDYWAENQETLGAIVTHVLIHEIGHHFGLSDDDISRIENNAREEQAT